jgi:hypothetical protein
MLDEKHQNLRKEFALKLFDRYTKRNSIAAYLQSHAMFGAAII